MKSKPIALIFGNSGGIGSCVRTRFLDGGYRIIPVNSDILDFNQPTADKNIKQLLTYANADVIVNCAGVFENGYQQDHVRTMNVNFGSNWSIVRHFMDPANQKSSIRLILIGSSSYDRGRKLYPLYSASKAALYNLWQASVEAFAETPVTIDLVNPVRTMTAMATKGKDIDPSLPYLKPEQVAEQIYKLVEENQASRCINMTFEDNK